LKREYNERKAIKEIVAFCLKKVFRLIFFTFDDCIFNARYLTAVNLASDIKELILLNEGVILPGLGGFVTTYNPAEIQKDSNLFQPPSMRVSFDSRMITDNGMLVSHIAHKNKFSGEEARLKVNEYIDELKKELIEKGSVSIEDVGILSQGPDGELTFKVAADKNYRLQSFGLPAIEVPHPVKPPETKPRTILSPAVPVIPRKKKKVPLAALIAFLILLAAGVIYFTGVFDRFLKPLFLANELASLDSMEYNGKIVFGQPVPAEEDTLAREVNQQLTYNTSKEKALYYQESEKSGPAKTEVRVPATKPPVAAPPVAAHPVTQSGNYYIVAGSFLKPGNADRQKKVLEKKGYSPRIVQKNDDFFYVTLQSYDSRETAKAEMSKLARNLDLPLWVMKK
jgi:hypothetical protein